MGKAIVVIGVACSAGLFWFGAMLAGTPYLTQTRNGWIACETLSVWLLAVLVFLATVSFGIGVDQDSR